jgi:hypothetical protein
VDCWVDKRPKDDRHSLWCLARYSQRKWVAWRILLRQSEFSLHIAFFKATRKNISQTQTFVNPGLGLQWDGRKTGGIRRKNFVNSKPGVNHGRSIRITGFYGAIKREQVYQQLIKSNC